MDDVNGTIFRQINARNRRSFYRFAIRVATEMKRRDLGKQMLLGIFKMKILQLKLTSSL